jgi:GT2 family glycosyltransferase
MTRIAILITCHNRRDATLAAMEALTENHLPDGVSIQVILVDDGSTDGTSAAISERYPFVEILRGNGNLYWNGGMHKAFGAALEKGYDFYLWLNDDTILDTGAISVMLETWNTIKAREGVDAIVVGSTRDDETGCTSYGGVVRPVSWKRTSFVLVDPGEVPKECETFNGNCVLIPKKIAAAVGNLDPGFVHAMGDTDYGLRARSAGFEIWLAPGYIGTCALNKAKGKFKDRTLSRVARLRLMMEPKGLPPASWKIFTRRHTGPFWIVFWILPYLRVVSRRSDSK